ncbi:inactive CLIP domain-containing serine protease A8-like [Anopheles marshallii]|uniref:inactive CLIP domain-containing serine protease A8-like n=1 Tax=Anopheles marshallii TaxID=1521116 RepID=UPI00237AB806|nr:inactive CLIP domain-containing serine protease A8-like [Anopheles marshallii]
MYFPIVIVLFVALANAESNSIIQGPEECYGGVCLPKHLCPTGIQGEDGVPTIRIDEDNACADFMKVCCKESTSNSTIVEIMEQTANNSNQKCGISNPQGLVYNVESNLTYAKYAEFPWTVAILQKSSSSDPAELTLVGAGTLIHPKFVLLAAHTLQGAHRYVARFGEWNMNSDAEIYPSQDIEIEAHFLHPEYIDAIPPENDIALGVLQETVIYSDHIRPLCLPSARDVFDRKRCIATGWGLDIRTEQPPSVMKRIEMNVWSQNLCEIVSKLAPLRLKDRLICANTDEYQNTCMKDGGAPLACQRDDGSYVLAGISSWVVYYRSPGFPAAYVDVAKYSTWINNIVHELD